MDQSGRDAGEEKAASRRENNPESSREEKNSKDPENKNENEPQKTPLFKRPVFRNVVFTVLLVFLVGGIIYWLHSRHYTSTDDAYIDGHITQVAPRVPAQVRALHIRDNQLVYDGDLLIELDPTDYQIALEQAQAQLVSSQARLGQQQAQLESARAAVVQASAEIDAAQVALDNASRDLQRYETVDVRARSRQQLDNATAAAKNAQAQFDQAQARKASAEADVNTTTASIKAAAGDVGTSEANVKRAQVNLGYCQIYAPVTGRVTQRTVDVGNFLQTGQTMFMLVSPEVWVTANFKETQLTHMRPGQPVTIKVDAFPGRKFHGHVDSIQAGSGSRFSVLPAENATGNFVKIVQRVPVKIVFDYGANTNDAQLLSPGLSVIPKVKIR